jgi:hypothetical protein
MASLIRVDEKTVLSVSDTAQRSVARRNSRIEITVSAARLYMFVLGRTGGVLPPEVATVVAVELPSTTDD